MYKKRIIQVSLVCLLLTVSVFVTGCLGGSSTTKAEVEAVLDKLGRAMLMPSLDVELILSCYTDPFYFHESGSETRIEHGEYSAWLEGFFRQGGYYESYTFINANVYEVTSTVAKVICDLHIVKTDDGKTYIQKTLDLEYTLVKNRNLGQWRIEQIVNRKPVSGLQTLSVLGLPQAQGAQE